MRRTDTIFAVSTGQGQAGVAVLRLSGTATLPAVKQIAGIDPLPRHAHFRTFRDPASDDIIDRGLVLFFPAPHSVTGEDVAEFHVHGSPAVLAKLSTALSQQAGMRAAEAGEFTRRAFINGKLDLLEVEGLADLLTADSEPQRKLAMRQFLGDSSSVIEGWRKQLLQVIAFTEAGIDFSDEIEVAERAAADSLQRLRTLHTALQEALLLSEQARGIRRGVRIVIAGPPNAGKSTLLNALARRDVAIVAPVAGTTRDVLEAQVLLSGIPVSLVDTAGLRVNCGDEIEQEGMRRAERQIVDADILLWVTAPDAVHPVPSERTPDLIVFNKMDLLPQNSIHVRNEYNRSESFGVSLKSGDGFEDLKKALEALLEQRFSAASHAIIVRDRHAAAVRQTIGLIGPLLIHKPDLEIMAEDLRQAAQALASITGRIDVEEFLGEIFASFCIGK